jgi:hypothetical protein
MTKPNYQTMTRKELLAYIRENRNDDEAFHAYMDKTYTESSSKYNPAPQSIDDLKHFLQLLEELRQQQE